MRITMIGTGYVGLVSGICFANLGHNVTCLDIDEKKIAQLSKGKPTIYEPGLSELMKHNIEEGRLHFTTDSKKAIRASEVIFISVGTPCNEKCEANLSYVFSAAETIGKHMESYTVVVSKSTVPVGTAAKIKSIINDSTKVEFDVVSNPEFLREGSAIKDFQNPDRIVVGCESERAKGIMELIYRDIARTTRPIMFTDVRSSELIKYAANAMLAARISFMNQLSHLCDKAGADIMEIAKGIGLDTRIGPRFLQAGIGYGGSCFPKDVQALIATLKEHGCDASLFEAVHEVNEKQKTIAIEKLSSLQEIKGSSVAVWGLAFKPKTDDIREAPAIKMIQKLQKMGAKINAFDPVAEENAKKSLNDITYFANPMDAIKGCDALIVATEWDEFRNPDFDKMISLMKKPVIIDGRNIYDPAFMKSKGFIYAGIGRG